MKNISGLLKKILVLMFIIYFLYTIIAQQKTLNSYAQEKEKYNDNIETAQEEQKELNEMKENINSDEYIDETISQSISELDLPDGILTDIQSYLSSDEGKEYLDNIQSSVGNGADKAISYFSSENFKTLISNAGEAIASGAESASEFFSSHSVTSE